MPVTNMPVTNMPVTKVHVILVIYLSLMKRILNFMRNPKLAHILVFKT